MPRCRLQLRLASKHTCYGPTRKCAGVGTFTAFPKATCPVNLELDLFVLRLEPLESNPIHVPKAFLCSFMVSCQRKRKGFNLHGSINEDLHGPADATHSALGKQLKGQGD